MGGFFGAVGNRDALADVFFGTDYHSHLGTRRGGIAAWDPATGLQREIHSLENSPFRTRFEHVFDSMHGTSAIGCISDYDPQPLLIRSRLGVYAICVVGVINNAQTLIDEYLAMRGCHFDSMTGGRTNSTELVAALINQKESFAEGIRYAQDSISGTASVLIMKNDGTLLAARDKMGRLPIFIGKKPGYRAVAFESFSLQKLGYDTERELGPGEIAEVSAEGVTQLQPPGKEMHICSFLWSYYGYPTSRYEGVNVEIMRYRNGAILARHDAENGSAPEIDYVGGVPDSGTPHAIGYANESRMPFSRAFIKYTPTWARSFMPTMQAQRDQIAKMKQIPVPELIEDKRLLFVDDSIVRGTQLRETVEFLYNSGAKEVHIRSACPPIMFGCKYLNFSRATSDMELIARRVIRELEGDEGFEHLEEYTDGATPRGKRLREAICKELRLASLEFQSLEGIVEAIGLPQEKLCTYCWNGKE